MLKKGWITHPILHYIFLFCIIFLVIKNKFNFFYLNFYYDCKGKLAKAWGLGGLLRDHSKLVYALISNVCRKSV